MSAISTADILDFLVAKSAAPSNMGAQLERLRNGTPGTSDPFRARDEVENHLMAQAQLIRCIDAFEARPVLPIDKPRAIERIQKECNLDQGRIALAILRAYHERATHSQIRGIAEVYSVLERLAPRATPPRPSNDNVAIVQMMREGKAKRCEQFASEAYADALLGMQQHVRAYNRKVKQ